MSRPTLKQVAAAAEVSLGTASNAFNKPDRLSTELRERVLDAAKTLGYTGPDPGGRRLRTGRSGALGLLFTDSLPFAFTDLAATEFLRGVALGLDHSDSGLLIVPGAGAGDDPARLVQGAAVDGFLVYSMPTNDPRTAAALARGLPTVTVDQPRSPDTAFVGIDDHAAAAEAARHLRELGHDKIDVLTFGDSARSQPNAKFEVTLERLAGYRDGLGGAWDPERVHVVSPNDSTIAQAKARQALERADPPTAILAMADSFAAGTLAAARDLGLNVPTDLSVVGFDDSPLATTTDPPLTTVAQPTEQKGKVAAELLVRAVEHGEDLDPDSRTILPHELKIRGTTAPPPH
jgi:DNA-binding LacI/PurR family transcriptional regulator